MSDLPPQAKDKEESIDDKIRKRRGGKGKLRLNDLQKTILILSKLKDVDLMTSNVNYHPGSYMQEIVNFFHSQNWRDIPNLVKRLEESGNVTKRPGRKGESPDFFYYRTEKGKKTLDDLLKTGILMGPEAYS